VSASPTKLPAAVLEEPGGRAVPVRSLVTSAIALVPAHCDCDAALHSLAVQAKAAAVGLYFVATGQENLTQVSQLTAQYGDHAALPMMDLGAVLGTTYQPTRLDVLFIYDDGTAAIARNLPSRFQASATLDQLKFPEPTTG
jgi:hypothetical protein